MLGPVSPGNPGFPGTTPLPTSRPLSAIEARKQGPSTEAETKDISRPSICLRVVLILLAKGVILLDFVSFAGLFLTSELLLFSISKARVFFHPQLKTTNLSIKSIK